MPTLSPPGPAVTSTGYPDKQLNLFIEAVQDYAIFMLDPQGHVISWNAGAERINGYKASEILGAHFSCFYPQEDVESGKPKRLLEATIRNGRVQDEGWRVRKNGERFWADVLLTAIRNDAGNLVGIGKVTRDLTQQRLTANTLLQQKQRLHLFVQAVQDYALFMLDPEGNVSSWNLGAERISGYGASEIIGRHFSCFYPEDVRDEKPRRELELAARDGRSEDDSWLLHKDGSCFWANVIITAVRDETGHLIGFGKVIRDLTAKMLTQKSLQEAQHKLSESEASLRRLSLHLLRTQDEERRRIGREIHDSLGQYLALLKIKLDSLQFPSEADASQCSELVDECIKQVRTISYLLYPPMLEEMGLTSAIPWYLEGFSNRSGIKTSFRASRDFGRLSRDAELVLFRVLQESLTNVQRHSESQNAEINISRNGNAIELEVVDHGKGLPDAVLEKGTQDWMGSLGVGLRGMSERLRQLRGTLEVCCTPGGGTTVRATVPEALQSE